MESGSLEAKGPNWWQRLPSWAKWTIGVIAALLLLLIGGAIVAASGEEQELKDEVASLEKRLSRAELNAENAEAETQKMEGEVSSLTEEAEAKAKKIVGDAKHEAASLEDSISSAEQELSSVEGDLSATESELGGAEEKVAKGTITDGVWTLEEDYLPGTYESEGGSGCYWALLSSVGGGGVEDIIENGGFNKHQILTIESPYFETSGCGTWHLIEE
jgi:hypothetical protein